MFPDRDGTLVGRDLEISIAERALLDAAAGGNRTLIISGEAGAGKSSLLAAIAARAKERRFLAGHGTAAPVEGAWPYAPVIEALCGVCQQDPGLLSGLPGPHRDEIDRARNSTPLSWAGHSTHQRLFLAAAELVRLAAAGQGLLLTVDDVHDADDGSLRLLHYLARSARGQRVCIVLAHRPVPAALPAGTAAWRRRGGASSTGTARPSSGSARSPTATPRRSSAATSPNPRPSWSGWSRPWAGASLSW